MSDNGVSMHHPVEAETEELGSIISVRLVDGVAEIGMIIAGNDSVAMAGVLMEIAESLVAAEENRVLH